MSLPAVWWTLLSLGLGFEPPPPLRKLAEAATRAVTLSNAQGTESSGTGRAEWGTWCDKQLLADATKTLDALALAADDGTTWHALWRHTAAMSADSPSAPPEAPAASLRVGGGPEWDLCLHLFASPAGTSAAERALSVRHADGTLNLLRPLVGTVVISKQRPSGETFGTPRELRAGAAEGALLQVGGPRQTYAAASSTAALLELQLRHPVQASSISPDLPSLEASPLLAAFYAAAEGPPSSTTPSSSESPPPPPEAAGALARALTSRVGGLEEQLEAIVRRVLASRADPVAARRLGVTHVRGILLSGPPGCGKTLLARELSRSLGAREPQVVNGPEIIDKFVGEAEKRVRALFAPAEEEWAAAGEASELHVIILDEMDAIAKRRGTSGDTSGVRDSVVNQLLAKMDGVCEAGNVLVVGLTNRPELLDPALLRPGRLEVHLEVRLPDAAGRRDILRIHTRAMRANEALSDGAAELIDSAAADGLAARTELFSGAELAGLVRSAASFALGRASLGGVACDALVRSDDLERALGEVRPALGQKSAAIARRFEPRGVGSGAHAAVRRALELCVDTGAGAGGMGGGGGDEAAVAAPARLARAVPESLLLVPEAVGAGASSLAAWVAARATATANFEMAAFVTLADLAGEGGGGSDGARCAALSASFDEARAHGRACLVLDDVDLMIEGATTGGVLRALLRTPLETPAADATSPPRLLVVGTASRPLAADSPLRSHFERLLCVPALRSVEEVRDALVRGAVGWSDDEASHVAAAVGGSPLLRDGLGVSALFRCVERAERVAGASARGQRADELVAELVAELG